MRRTHSTRIETITTALLLSTLAVVSLLAWVIMREQSDGAADATRNAEACKLLAKQIGKLRELETKATSASPDDEQNQDMGEQILAVARECNIPNSQISAIQSLSPIDITDSDYKRHDTSITLTRISIPDLVAFLLACQDSKHLCPTQVSLRSGTFSASGQELWTTEVKLSRMIYSAKSANINTKP